MTGSRVVARTPALPAPQPLLDSLQRDLRLLQLRAVRWPASQASNANGLADANPSSAPSSASLNDSSSIQPSTRPISMNIHCMVDIPKHNPGKISAASPKDRSLRQRLQGYVHL
jgi:hypothetical protein